MTDCTACPNAAIAELPEFADLADSCPPAHPRLYTEHAIHRVEYFHGQLGLAAWLCPLPAPAQLLIS